MIIKAISVGLRPAASLNIDGGSFGGSTGTDWEEENRPDRLASIPST